MVHAVAACGLRLAGVPRAPWARPGWRPVAGGALFGAGWRVTGVCPGTVAVQLGQGVGWAAIALVGMAAGILLHDRRRAARATPV